jgi:Tfp pilus assembly protein PilZ
MAVKIVRNKYGHELSDICETINVSRTGLYFTTHQGYDVGEDVRVILPYHPDSMAIPVPARVVRREERAGTYRKGVAVHLAFGSAPPS